MKLKVRTINWTAALIGGVTAIFNTILAVLLNGPWWVAVITCMVSFMLISWLSYSLLSNYVIFRIKPLYQLLLSRDIITSRLSKALRQKIGNDLVNDIQENLDELVALSDSEIDRLKQKERERSDFLVAVFHELRTPIFNIEGYAHTLLDGAIEDPQVSRKFLERIIRSADRLSALVEDIDKISQYESGGMIMYKDDFDIVDLVHEVIDTNIINSTARGIQVKVSLATFPANEPIVVHADRLRISQVLDSLLLNALQFNNEGGSVTVSFIDMFDKILVEVSDNGIGISPKEIHHIFEKFYRVEKSRSREKGGMGLGLPGAKNVIDAHGENMTVRSELGVGTTFSFTLLKGAGAVT